VAQTPSFSREVSGSIVDLDGKPLANVRVTAAGFHAAQTQPETTTDASGAFHLTGLLDANAYLRFEADGFYSEIAAVYLEGSADTVELEPLGLVAKQPNRVRLWLAGDTMFGRRFEDADEDGQIGEDGDLIHPSTRAEDAYQLLHFLEPALKSADFRMSNFESPASTAIESRHPFKQYSFSSHPDTLAALKRVGIDAVSLGNNHSYDYREAGRIETAQVLNRQGIAFFGSGASELDARGSFLDVDLNGVPLSFQGFDGIKPNTYYPEPHDPWPPELLYYAMDTPIVKGGALLLSSDNVANFMKRDPERLRIPVMHGGEEYGDTPTSGMRDRFSQAFQAGAKLVVAHHSHSVYGVALWGDLNDPGLSLLSLGNFLFDQDVFETFNSFMAVVDIDRASDDSYHVLQARLIPFHQENYVPSLISGWQAERLARHVGQISTFLPDRDDGLRPAVLFKDAAGIGVMLRASDYQQTDHTRARTLTLDAGKSSPFPLNDEGGATDYLTGFSGAPDSARLRLAQDLLIYGDFEDYDLDDKIAENDNWWQTDTRYPTADRARSGRYSIALYREQGASGTVNTQLRNRITFEPGSELSFGCHALGDHAGAVTVTVEYIQRDTRNKIGEDKLMSWAAGSYDWTEHHAAVSPPSEAGHVRFVITMQPSATGGTMYLDDCKLYSWGPSLATGEALPTPHGYDWARLEVPNYSGDVSYTEQRRTYRRVYGAH